MRILIGHNYYQQPGGEDRVFEDEVALLEREGHEVVRYSVHNDRVEELSRTELARAAFWNPHTFDELTKLLVKTKPDVAHFHNTFPLISPSAYDACLKAGVPIVQTLHNYRLLCPAATLYRDNRICEDCLGLRVKWPAVLHKCYRGDRKASGVVTGMLAYHSFRGTWEKVDRFIAISSFLRQKFIAEGMDPEKIVVKSNSVTDSHPVGRSGQRISVSYALFVGRLVPEKGISTLLAAWRSLGRRIPLKIVGDGPMASTIKEAETEIHGVAYLGPQSREEVADLMRQATFVIVPSQWHEPFGLVAAEAFAAGTPVVASDKGGLPELVEEGVTGYLFKAEDPTSLIAAVHKLLANEGGLVSMRYRARQAYEDRYSQAVSYHKLMEIYSHVRALLPRSK